MSNQIKGTNTIPKKLFDILEMEIKLSNDLLAIIKDEKKALVDVDLEALVSLSSRKENQLQRIQMYDESLQVLMRKTVNAPEAENINLSAIKHLAGNDEEAERLEGCRANLSNLRQEIIDGNLFNKRFASDTLGYLSDAISLITGAIHEHSLYSQKGNTANGSKSPALISREV